MKSAGKARSNGLYRHIRTSKEIIRNLLNDSAKKLRLCDLSFGKKAFIFYMFLICTCKYDMIK